MPASWGISEGNLSYDAIVVGAGHNGLAAAVHLASKGWKVAVVERANSAGGAVRTEEVTLPGYRHDLFAMNLSMFAGSAFFAAHKEGLLRHGLDFVPVADSFASAFPDGKWLGVSTDLDATTARIEAFSKADAAQWRRMAQAFPEEAAYIGGVMGTPMPSFEVVQLLVKALRKKGYAWVRDMVKLLISSPRAYLDANFESQQVRALMAAWGLHLDFGPDIAGGAVFPYLESMANQNFGMVIGKGGADTIIKAMSAYLTALGGEIHFGRAVTRIVEESGRASAVELDDGSRLTASRAVIANVHPQILANKLLGQSAGATTLSSAVRNFRPGPGTMMLHLALSDLPDWTASPELRRFAYVHLAPDYQMMSRAYQQATSGLLPSEPALVVGQPTALDPSRAPAGKHVLWVQARVVPYDIKGDAEDVITARDWDSVKEAYAERILSIIERYAPGLRGKIEGTHILSPLDLERANPNLVHGDSLSGSHHLDQNFLFRPAGGWSRHKTPVRNLYMVGASTWPGAGTGAGSGFMLGKALAGK